MPKKNKGPFIAKRNDVDWWRYDFWLNGKRHRGWIGACSEMPKKDATDAFNKTWANILTNNENPYKKRSTKLPTTILSDYSTYLKRHRPETYKSYKYVKSHIEGYFGKMTSVDEKAVQKFHDHMGKKRWGKKGQFEYSESTINRMLSYCRAAFKRAKVSPNPFEGFDRYTEPERTRYLTEDELKRLLDAALNSVQSQLKTIVLTAILTGLRKDEILGLHESNVDFGNNIIRTKVKGGKLHTTGLPDELALPFKRLIKKHESGYVFENPYTQTRFGDVRSSWHKALKDAKIENFVFHDLRHTHATYMLLTVSNLKLVQELLGHASVRTTQKYAHILSEQKYNAIKKLTSALGVLSDEIKR